MKNRWYDQDATTSLAVSLLKNSNAEIRLKCAELVTNYAKKHNVTLPSNLFDKFDYTLRRWYDENEQLTEALEYLRVADLDLQKEIAFEMIEFLQLAEIG